MYKPISTFPSVADFAVGFTWFTRDGVPGYAFAAAAAFGDGWGKGGEDGYERGEDVGRVHCGEGVWDL